MLLGTCAQRSRIPRCEDEIGGLELADLELGEFVRREARPGKFKPWLPADVELDAFVRREARLDKCTLKTSEIARNSNT